MKLKTKIDTIGTQTARLFRRNGLTRLQFRGKSKLTPHWTGFTDQQKRHANVELHATHADLARSASNVERLLERARWE